MFGVLRRRDFALLWFAGLISTAGDWALFAALPYFVYLQTGSTLATAGMTAAELAPGILLGTVAGVFIDRWDRKRVLVACNLLQAVTVTALLLVPHGGPLSVVYAVAAVQSSISAFSMPTETAVLPSLVRTDQLLEANAMNALNNRVGRLAGVPAGAVLLGWLGLDWVVFVDSASFLAAALLVTPIVIPSRPEPHEGVLGPAAETESALRALWNEWVQGLRTVGDDRAIAVLFVVFGLMTFGGTMLDPLFVPWVRDILDQGPSVYALLMTTHACAGILGSLLIGAVGSTLPARALIGWTSVAAGMLLVVRFNVPVVWVAVVLSAIGGMTAVASSVGVETLAQQRVPESMRGRVFGSLQSTIWLLSLLGATVGGILGEAIGIVPALDVAALLTAVAGIVVLVAIPRTAEDTEQGTVYHREAGLPPAQ
jgi:predicted MFS family arabinose efflux permease